MDCGIIIAIPPTHPPMHHTVSRNSLPVLSMMSVGIWRMFGLCLEDSGVLNGILTVSGRCLESFWKVSGRYMKRVDLG